MQKMYGRVSACNCNRWQHKNVDESNNKSKAEPKSVENSFFIAHYIPIKQASMSYQRPLKQQLYLTTRHSE